MKILDEMKEVIKHYTKEQKAKFVEVEEPWETVTLYHGTTSKQLNSILKNGLTPRNMNQVNNFEHVPSNDELVYLTNRWHYWYAYNANQESLIKSVGKDRYETEPNIEKLWNETEDFPMYVTCEVPIELLTLDEDVVYQRYIRKELREGTIQSPQDITVDACLQQGTVASIAPILPEYISEIVILGNPEYREFLLEGSYGKDVSNWFHGFGKGETDLYDILYLEVSKFKNGIGSVFVEPINNELVEKLTLSDKGLDIVRTKSE